MITKLHRVNNLQRKFNNLFIFNIKRINIIYLGI